MSDYSAAIKYIQNKTDMTPELAIVLGSGLSSFVDTIENPVSIPYQEIPGFVQTTVEGHNGALIFGEVQGVSIAVCSGRFHAYEGYALDQVVFPVRALALCGVKKLILTNASGGINKSYAPGDLVVIADQINMTGSNVLVGKNNASLGERFPDMSDLYSKELRKLLHQVYTKLELQFQEGTYMGVLGPSYETPAEVQMLRGLGGDLVGMSTVHEAIAAHHMGLEVVGISCVTNMAAGIFDEKLAHADVEKVAQNSRKQFATLVTEFVKEVGA